MTPYSEDFYQHSHWNLGHFMLIRTSYCYNQWQDVLNKYNVEQQQQTITNIVTMEIKYVLSTIIMVNGKNYG